MGTTRRHQRVCSRFKAQADPKQCSESQDYNVQTDVEKMLSISMVLDQTLGMETGRPADRQNRSGSVGVTACVACCKGL